jgi:hypothetical protein
VGWWENAIAVKYEGVGCEILKICKLLLWSGACVWIFEKLRLEHVILISSTTLNTTFMANTSCYYWD